MKLEPACLPCILNQTFTTCKIFGINDPEKQRIILNEIMSSLLVFDHKLPSPYFSRKIQSTIEKHSIDQNPYKTIKYNNYKKVKKIIPLLNEMVENSRDKLKTSIKIAIIGNSIDMGANPHFNLEQEITRINSHIFLKDYSAFLKNLATSSSILYIGDNFEEAVFDMFLIKQLSTKNVTFAVRSEEILNDITLEDAKFLKTDKLCKIIESGSKIAGTDIIRPKKEFKKLLDESDLVISKGQGNYETLSGYKRQIYFMLRIKCDMISEKAGYPNGSGVLIKNGTNTTQFNLGESNE